MSAWLTIGFLVALIGSQATANDVYPDFAENVNSRMGGSRIVSGWEAEPGAHPHQCSLRMSNWAGQVSACGGSIIHQEWVMTAAHCTAGRAFIVVRAGLVNLTRPEYIYETNEWYNHPLYNDALPGVVQPHDISVMKLQRKVIFSPNLRPIRLQSSADQNKNYHGIRLLASGWGLTWTQGTSPEHLNWVYLLGMSNIDCLVAYGFSPIITATTICARYYNVTSQSTCQGDSGGPLSTVEQDGQLTMVGVASFVSGQGCHTEAPAGFIQPGSSGYHAWYRDVTGINFDWNWEDSEEDTTTATAPPAESSEEDTTTVTAPPPESSEEEVVTPTNPPVESSEEVVTPTIPPSESSSEEEAESSEEETVSSEEEAESSEEEAVTVTAFPPKSSEEESVTVPEPSAESSEEEAESSEEEAVTVTAFPPKSSEEELVTVPESSAVSSEEEAEIEPSPPVKSSESSESSESSKSSKSSEE